MFLCLIVGGQEGCMEDIVDFPSTQELKTIGYVWDFSGYPEGSIPSWGKFHGVIREFQIGSFQPDFIVFFKWFVFYFFD